MISNGYDLWIMINNWWILASNDELITFLAAIHLDLNMSGLCSMLWLAREENPAPQQRP